MDISDRKVVRQMKVIDAHNIDRKKWAEFVYHHPQGTIFQTPEMYEVYKNTKNYEPILVSVVDDSNEILGLLLSVVQKEFSGPLSILSSRCVTWGGPLIRENLDKKDKTAVLEIILEEQNKIAKKKAIYMQFRNLWDTSRYKSIFEKYGYEYEDHLDILIDLTKSEEELWKQMKKSRRWGIRKATKFGLKFYEDCDVKTFYEMIDNTYRRAKIPLADVSLFQSAIDMLSPKKRAYIFCVKDKDGKVVASWFQLAYKNLVYDWYAGSTPEGNKMHANEYLGWKILLWAKNRGYQIYDFGGAGRPNEDYGPGKFKMEFGGAIVNYGRYQYIFRKRTMKFAIEGLKLWKRVIR